MPPESTDAWGDLFNLYIEKEGGGGYFSAWTQKSFDV